MRKSRQDAVVLIGDQAKPRPMRSDGQRKLSSVLAAAMEVFAASGVDAPIREIAEKAGVGLGTVYRHFPQRSDLIAAVMQSQVDACADAAAVCAGKYLPAEALVHWLYRFMDLLGTKRGLAAALHSGNPAYAALPAYFLNRIGTALESLLKEAVAAKVIRSGIHAEDLLWTVSTMCQGPHGAEPSYARKMVTLLVDGMRYGAPADRKT